MPTQTDWASYFTSGAMPQQGGYVPPAGFNPSAPPASFDQSKWNTDPLSEYQRNQQQEGWGNWQAQAGMMPYQIWAQQQFGPAYSDVQYNYSKGKVGETAGSQASTMPILQQGANAAQNSQRANDVGGLGSFAQQFTGAMDAANPQGAAVRNTYANELTKGAPQVGALGGVRDVNSGQVGQVNDALLNNLNVQAGNASKTGLQQTQEQIAAADLAKGGSLAPEEVNNLVQQIRGRGESSGLVNSNRTFANELLGLDSAQRQRQAERMAQAQSVDAAGYGQTQGNREFGLNTVSQNRGVTGQNMTGAMFNVGQDLNAQQANQGADQFRTGLDYQRQATNAGLQQNQTSMLGQGMGQFQGM